MTMLIGLVRKAQKRAREHIVLEVAASVFSMVASTILIKGDKLDEKDTSKLKIRRENGIFLKTKVGIEATLNMDAMAIRININKVRGGEEINNKEILIVPEWKKRI